MIVWWDKMLSVVVVAIVVLNSTPNQGAFLADISQDKLL